MDNREKFAKDVLEKISDSLKMAINHTNAQLETVGYSFSILIVFIVFTMYIIYKTARRIDILETRLNEMRRPVEVQLTPVGLNPAHIGHDSKAIK